MFIILIYSCSLGLGIWFDTKHDIFIKILNFRCKCVTCHILWQVSHFDDFTGRIIATTSEIVKGENASPMNRAKCESFLTDVQPTYNLTI